MTKAEERKLNKEIRAHQREQKRKHKKDLALLRYMKKTGLKFYHHNTHDGMIGEVKKALKECRESKPNFDQDYWARYRMYSDTLFDCVWSHDEFETIYDVPLDGTYRFHIYDSGRRGYGAKNNITTTKNEQPDIPEVNPGGIPPTTAK